MTGFPDQAIVRRQPIYLLLDVSESMARKDRRDVSSLDVFQPMIDRLVLDLGGMPRINISVWLSVLAFSDDVQPLREMTPLIGAQHWIQKPRLGRETNYTLALRTLADRYPTDARRIIGGVAKAGHQTRLRSPLVFVFTDGAPFADGQDQPGEAWKRERERVIGGDMRAWLAAVSIRDQHERTLWELATGNGAQRNAFVAAVDAPAEALAAGIRQCIAISISKSIRAGEQVLPRPHGMRFAGPR